MLCRLWQRLKKSVQEPLLKNSTAQKNSESLLLKNIDDKYLNPIGIAADISCRHLIA